MKYDICVFGGCALDRMYYLDENGGVTKTPNILVPGGKGANQAVAASRAGAKVTIISKLGKDDIGETILDNLTYNGVSTNNIEVIEGINNDYSDIYINNKNKDNDIKRFSGAINSFTPDMIKKYKDVILNSKMVVGQMKVPKEVSIELINLCDKYKIPIIITPCRPEKLSISEEKNSDLINKITFITANKKECETIFGTNDIESCVTKYPNKLIVTLGESGLIYHNGEKIVYVDAIKVPKVEDTTGAGDTFSGNLAAALVSGMSLKDAIIRAQYASSMKIQHKTAQEGMPYKEDLDKYIRNTLLDDNDHMEEFELGYRAIMDAYDVISKNNIFNIKQKDDATFVTDSDYKVEKSIIDSIIERYPNDNFVTEEFNSNNQVKGRTWIIDPIDGTIHYMKNSIFWGIQLAFIDNGETQFSIIYLPKLNEVYYAVKGCGTYINNKKANYIEDMPMGENIIEFTGSIPKLYEEKKELFNKFLNNQTKPGNFMHINSSCIAFTNFLSNRCDTIVCSTKKPWDIVPGLFMLDEAGYERVIYNNLIIYSKTKEVLDMCK